MIPEAPFLFSIAALSASLAGLAGLVVGLRRGTDMRPVDMFRLRQIVEFSFSNVILAVGVIPLALILGSSETAVRIGAVTAVAYGAVAGFYLVRRTRREGIQWTGAWVAGVAVLNLTLLVLGVVSIVTGSTGWYEALLVILLARPMFAFLLVIEAFGDRTS